MSYEVTGRRRPTKPKKQARAQKRKRDDVDVGMLERSVTELDPRATFTKFTDLPLSEPTKAGLKACHFINLTDIQAKAMPLALKGSDILGAAKTGSGKTLTFLIPVLENLYRAQCVGVDAGLGAMIISPTRELAIQIFDVLYKIGKHGHVFAAGLIIGGKSLQEEQHALARMNIVVCTPGRMLQHLSQTASFNIDNLQMLVLDEADRIMDMGFQRDVDAIIEYLPPDRQTLLFSATQTKRVSDLARLSLREPEYVSVHEASTSATPQTLQQNYVLTHLPDKLDTLWSFLKSSKKSKILVFLSSGKQVRYVYESLRRLQPGVPLLHLHGRQKPGARLEITSRFAAARHACLFATDVAARGLDFPAVDWVVQFDCPEDADTYIHRVGRTARFERDGRAVLFLDPAEEEGMLARLAAKKVPVERINVRARKQSSIRSQLQAMCFKDPQLKYLGQKAFASYVRSLHLQRDKEVFKLADYALEDFAASLGLPGAPRIRFLKGDAEAVKARKNAPRRGASPLSESEAEAGDDDGAVPVPPSKKKPTVRTKYDRMFERRNQDILADHYTRMIAQDGGGGGEEQPAAVDGNALTSTAGETNGDGGDDDDLFTVKRCFAASASLSPSPSALDPQPRSPTTSTSTPLPPRYKPPLTTTPVPLLIDSNRRLRALKSRSKTAKLLAPHLHPTHLVFDAETGRVPRDAGAALFEDERVVGGDAVAREEAKRVFLERERSVFSGVDKGDRVVERERKREARGRKKAKEKEREREMGAEGDGEGGAMVARGEDDDDDTTAQGPTTQPFSELADLYPDSDGDGAQQVKTQPKKKEKEKWFQDGSSGDDNGPARKKIKAKRPQAPPETLEDMEDLARGLLG